MAAALGLARRGLGRVWPNPSVGCVILDRNGRVAGRGHTGSGGRPHAETRALAEASALAEGGTAYVTLEPCAHWGETPPCVEALIAARLARVVVAIEDPDPRVAGRGLRRLAEAGIALDIGCRAEEARDLNAGFFSRVTQGRPLVTLKLATSLDGRIALANGASRWITGETSRRRGHLLRADHDAILIGSGTALADDPQLDCRLPGLEAASPLRILLDRRRRVSPEARIFAATDCQPTWLMTAPGGDLDAYRRRSVEVVEMTASDPPAILAELGRRGLTRVLIEGGAGVATAFLRAGLVDRLAWFRAGRLIGGDGLAGIGVLDLADLTAAPDFRLIESCAIDRDIFELYRREN